MSLWGRIFAAGYCRFNARFEREFMQDRRRELLRHARGRVIEVGTGPGLNLDHYPPAVDELVLTEPEQPMVEQLEKRLAERDLRAQVVAAPAQRLPFEDDSFDTAVCTLTLCTVPDVGETLDELARVLRPGGELLFIEHVRSDDPGLAKWQDRLAPAWRRFGHGCNCNRDTLSVIRGSRFRVEDVDRTTIPKAIPLVKPVVIGRAAA